MAAIVNSPPTITTPAWLISNTLVSVPVRVVKSSANDGCLCLASAEGGMDAGIWDGVTMMWVCTAISPRMELQDFSLLHADYIYLWDEQEREFVDGKSSQSMHWKFSRNFLASKSNHGHWTIEGDIPVRPFPHLPVRLLSRPARDFLCVCLLSRSPW